MHGLILRFVSSEGGSEMHVIVTGVIVGAILVQLELLMKLHTSPPSYIAMGILTKF